MNDKPRILVAEDNIALNGILRFNLANAGYNVTTAKNGQEAIGFVDQQRFDVIVSDQQMPHATGIELCEHIRKTELNAEVPFVLLTAKAFEVDRRRLQEELHVVDVIQKPFSPAAIVETVGSLLVSSQTD